MPHQNCQQFITQTQNPHEQGKMYSQLKKILKYAHILLCRWMFLCIKMIYNTVLKMSAVFYTVYIVHICVFTTCPTSCSLCNTLINPWNVCIYVCMYTWYIITDQIHELILEDHQISAKSIAEQLGISLQWVGSIIHEDLDILVAYLYTWLTVHHFLISFISLPTWYT